MPQRVAKENLEELTSEVSPTAQRARISKVISYSVDEAKCPLQSKAN